MQTLKGQLFFCFILVFNLSFGQRLQTSLNEAWKFIKLDASQFQTNDLNDQYWKPLNLPHSWNAEDAFDDERGYYQGIGCYRKRWIVPAAWKGKSVLLHFEGVNQTAEVYVNGKLATNHKGGYTAFRAEVSDLLKYGEENLIAVRVSNAPDPHVAPLSADFTFYGGIYRNVWAIVAEPSHFDMVNQNLGTDAFIVQTKEDKKNEWTVSISGQAVLAANSKSRFAVRATLIGPDNQSLASKTSPIKVKGKEPVAFQLEIPAGRQVEKYSPENPTLYKVKAELLENDLARDQLNCKTAFFSFSINPENGAFLNGKPIKLLGANRHQDFEGLGNALPDDLHRADAERIKEMGGNFIRISHYPQSGKLLEACDQLGLLVWEEIPIVDEITPNTTFRDNCASQLKEMIAQHRNHPSVIMWGYMNEVLIGIDRRIKGDSLKEIRMKETVVLASFLDSIVRKTDVKRLTTMALHNSQRYNKSGLGNVAQVTGWNLYHGWYHDRFPDFGTFMDKDHADFPKRSYIISEFGAGSDLRLFSNQPEIFDFTPQYQWLYLQSYMKQIMERPWIAGATVWNLIDFGSEGRKETMPHINNKGLFTMNRKKKDAFFLMQAWLTKEPMAHLALQDWDSKVLIQNGKAKLYLISNQETVHLFIGNQKVGEVKVQDRMSTFETAMEGKPVWIRLETPDGKILNHQFVIPIQAPDIRKPEFKSLAVNLGATFAYQKPESQTIWFPTQAYQPGSWGTVGGKIYRIYKNRIGTQSYVSNTTDQPLYQTQMDSLQAFKADLPDGQYEIELLFAELEPKVKPSGVLYDLNQGQKAQSNNQNRIFNILVNGKLWKERFEPSKDLGGFVAGSYKMKVDMKEGKGLEIGFQAISGGAILNGIRIEKE
jgi:beta-galactosidase